MQTATFLVCPFSVMFAVPRFGDHVLLVRRLEWLTLCPLTDCLLQM